MSDNTEKSLGDFERTLEQLEQIVNKMEQGQLSLDESLSAFEEGVKLTRACQDSLKNAEQKVSQLMKDGDQLIEKPFEPSPMP